MLRSSGHIVTTPPAQPLPTALAVDDDPLLLTTYARALRHKFTVTTCETPMEALERLAAGERFDVVISDVQMPRLNGPEFYRRAVRLWPELAGVVVFLSGGCTFDEQDRIREIGAPLLMKPFNPDELVAALRARMNARQ